MLAETPHHLGRVKGHFSFQGGISKTKFKTRAFKMTNQLQETTIGTTTKVPNSSPFHLAMETWYTGSYYNATDHIKIMDVLHKCPCLRFSLMAIQPRLWKGFLFLVP